jgi:hypothetical protein
MKWAQVREQIRHDIHTKKRRKRGLTEDELNAIDRRLQELRKRKGY